MAVGRDRFNRLHAERSCLALMLLLLAGVLAPVWALPPAASIVPRRLRCEQLENPLGIDAEKPRLSWMLDAAAPAARPRGLGQSAYQILVASSAERLDQDQGDLWDSGKVASDQSLLIPYAGRPLPSRTECHWKVRVWDLGGGASGWSAPARWTMGLLRPEDWRGQWIAAHDGRPGGQKQFFRNGDRRAAPPLAAANQTSAAAVLLRRAVTLAGRPRRATATFCGLGYCELFINGRRVGDHVMDPVFTDFGRRVAYVTYDVTEQIRSGANVFGAILGNGFYCQPTPDLFQFEKAWWRTPPRLLLNVLVEFEDGRSVTIASDKEWKWSTGEITFNCIRGGETIDHRRDPGPWLDAAFDDHAWHPVRTVAPPPGRLAAQQVHPMRVTERLRPVGISEPKPGLVLVDFGRNLTGWVRLETSGRAGQKITLDFNEVLLPDGTLDTRHSAGHTYGRYQHGELILAGRGRESYEPRFTYHGFRYVQIAGLNEKLTTESITACRVHSDLPSAGRFACANPRLNQLQGAVRRTLLDCIHGMPGEEPTREKMGWNQDAQNTMEAYLFNFDAAAAYAKYVQDMLDGQQANGHVPPILPTNGWGLQAPDGQLEFCDDPWWGATLAVAVNHLYQYCGDRQMLERAYEPMKRYVDFLATTAKDNVINWSLGDWLDGKWTGGHPGLTPVPVTSTAGYAFLASLLAEDARILGKTDDAARYGRQAAAITATFNTRFLDRDGWYARNSQTAQALALALGLAPPERRAAVRDRLVEDIERNGRHLTTGFVGVMPTLHWLADNGEAELAYAAVTQEQGSGWLYMVQDDNATLGENIHPSGYGSRHHPFAACIGSWLFRDLAGIRPDPAGPGFRKIIIRPGVVRGLDWVEAAYDAPTGRIESAWRREGGRLTLNVKIPPNSTATVTVPARDDWVTESGKAAVRAPGVKLLRQENGATVYEVGSGSYAFEARPE